jgi:hypothetical protein
VSGSTVTFNSVPSGLSNQTDYVTIYGSRKGNSGAFKISSTNGNQVTVDTSALPGGSFVSESAGDPGELQAALLRPVHFTAWDRNNPPTWDFSTAMYYGFNRSAIMLSYLRSTSGNNNEVWGAIYLDGDGGGSNDYFIVDHVEIANAATAIGLSNNDFHANYAILQHNYFHNIGWAGGVSDEIIYWGNFLQYQKHHDYPQIMYNRVGPHKSMPTNQTYGNQAIGDGIEVKASGHYPTIWGNIITGLSLTNGCDDSPIHSAGQNGFIANNFISDIYPQPENIPGCGISIVEGAQGANGTIVANNIIANVKSIGIRIFNTSNVQVVNNTIYNIRSIQGCCAEESAGILIQTYGQGVSGNIVRNNIVANAPVGYGRYPWDTGNSFSVTTSNNIAYNTTTPWGVGFSATGISTANPNLVNPGSQNFTLGTGSAAIGAGTDLTSLFALDNHNAINPSAPGPVPTVRTGSWSIGAYQVGGAAPSVSPSPSLVPSPSPSPSPVVSPSASPSPSVVASPSPSPDVACRAADINQDGSVTTADRSLLLGSFFQQPASTPRADINGDGRVDVTDYGLLARSFGLSCP